MDGGGQICFTVTKHFVLVYVRHDVEIFFVLCC
jgi:hypothetical protein